MQLVRAHALLRSCEQVRGEKPLVQRDMRALVNRSHGHAKGLLALVALEHAGTGALALELHDALGVRVAAMRAGRTIGPLKGLKVLTGCFSSV